MIFFIAVYFSVGNIFPLFMALKCRTLSTRGWQG